MRQINYVFGSTLEISTTIGDDGSIRTQEIMSSAPDALVTFKIDGASALTPMMLRELADRIEGLPAQTTRKRDSECTCPNCDSIYCCGDMCSKTGYQAKAYDIEDDNDCPF